MTHKNVRLINGIVLKSITYPTKMGIMEQHFNDIFMFLLSVYLCTSFEMMNTTTNCSIFGDFIRAQKLVTIAVGVEGV